MSLRRSPSPRSARSVAAGSWLALLAATTLGDAADTLRAEVKADGLSAGAVYRLVVQSYDGAHRLVPASDARPVGSLQRAVTADELRNGVHVNLVQLRHSASGAQGQSPVVVAWIEAGEPDLEFDGRTARPRPGSVFGVVRRGVGQDVVHISLDRTIGA
jgi:hypothetical protein